MFREKYDKIFTQPSPWLRFGWNAFGNPALDYTDVLHGKANGPQYNCKNTATRKLFAIIFGVLFDPLHDAAHQTTLYERI